MIFVVVFKESVTQSTTIHPVTWVRNLEVTHVLVSQLYPYI